ncbi:hypothetical protein LPJ68_000648 [Coemansia sp. RSA 1086]|nr:hypothetical protein LPJ68_000648 [Coemansia sp. RSA 1086]
MYQAIRASSKCLRSPSNNDLKLQLFALYQTYADFKNKKLRIQEVSIKASALVHAFSNDCPDNLLQAETECIVISDSDQVESDADTLKETDLLDSTFVGPDERSWTVSDFPNCSPLYADQPGSLICSPDCQALVNVLQALVDSQKDIASIEKKKLAVELRAVELEEQREAIRQARRCAKLMTKAARGKP